MALNETIGKDVTTRAEIKSIREYYKDICKVIVKRNAFYAIISFSPLMIAIVMTILYISGANNIGLQRDISISGIVVERRINHDKQGKVSGYELKLVDSLNSEKYLIPIDLEIYN